MYKKTSQTKVKIFMDEVATEQACCQSENGLYVVVVYQ